jgi:TetR/AcrR family transcriptional repressor of nem operon
MMSIMRYPEGHKEAVRDRIVQVAAEALRSSGLAGVSIPALMKLVGLTHGGFYAHFTSRDELVAEAVRTAAAGTWRGAFADGLSLADTLKRYLSPGHLDHPEQGCVLAALGPEGSRQPPPVRTAFAEVTRGLLRAVDRKLHPGRTTRTISDDALRLAATMVGAVVLGRLVDDPALAGRLLAAARSSAPE